MRICIISKFPPIQGGVSMRTYWSAHGLAALGHEVHVVTNAKEAVSPFRMLMGAEDWKRCAAAQDRGSVTVHWTDPADRSQSYTPMASPFVSKLAAVAAGAFRTALRRDLFPLSGALRGRRLPRRPDDPRAARGPDGR
jgi:hypothetical protein